MNIQLPNSRAEWEALVKENAWTILVAGFGLVALWQGLTLYSQMRSWESLETRVQNVVMKDPISAKKDRESGEDVGSRSITETFFYRPSSSYKITAILGDLAVVNGKEVKIGDSIEKAVVEKIELNSVTLKIEGEANPKRIELHPGL